MRYLIFLSVFLFINEAIADNVTVKDVTVSVTADSAAAAREEALDQAHTIAFQKLLKEDFPEKTGPLPSPEALKNMVTGISINKEKTSDKSYTASLTFHFDGNKLHEWLNSATYSSSTLPQNQEREGSPLNVTAQYKSLSQWYQIKRVLETYPGIKKLTIATVSPKRAELHFLYTGDIHQVKNHLSQKGLFFSQEGNLVLLSLKDAEEK
ncbi:MAG: hypothetical protein K2P93_09025 [Alphaproteobacteria bacterium]|nr:hypothetical protein [Alphaproteobacteria bacterium]